jgi:hypothetical protein
MKSEMYQENSMLRSMHHIGAGREYTDRFYYGANLTFISSQFESYTSNGGANYVCRSYHRYCQWLHRYGDV